MKPNPGLPRLVAALYERLSGSHPWSLAARLQEVERYDAAALEALTAARLRALAAGAARHVPYYRDLFRRAGIGVEDILATSDLARIPATTKEALRERWPDGVVAADLPPGRRRSRSTGGSTGKPFDYYADRHADGIRRASYLHIKSWAGLEPAAARIHIASLVHFQGPPSARSLALRRWLLGEWTTFVLGSDLTLDLVREHVARLGRRPYFLWTYPSFAARLAADLVDSPSPLASLPRVVVCYGETLTPTDAELIQRAFGCRIFNVYSTLEVPLLAVTCPEEPQLLHVNPLRAIVRVVRDDGSDAAPGERGRVLITDLANDVMPFINYDVEDVAVRGPRCSCGREWPTLASIEGRSAERVRMPDGRTVSPPMVSAALLSACHGVDGVRQYQAARTAIGEVTLRIVPGPDWSPRLAERIRAEGSALFGPGVTIRVETLGAVPPEPSGKRLILKSEVSLDRGRTPQAPPPPR